MSALLAAGAACARPECGHDVDLHDGICHGTTCECVRFVEPTAALPMPAGPAPQLLSLTEEQIEALVAAGDRVVNDAVHEDLCACDAWPGQCVSTGHYFMGAWDVGGLDTALPAVLGLWEQMRGGELAAFRSLELGDPDGRVSASCGNPSHPTWLRAKIDPRGCPWCEIDQAHEDVIGANLARHEEEQENAQLRAQVSALLEERRRTNEWADDAAKALRADRDRIAELEAERAKYVGAEPTIAEEMAYLSRCVQAVGELTLPETLKVESIDPQYRNGYVHALADMRLALESPERSSYPPALPWARLMDDDDRAMFLDELADSATTHASSDEVLKAVEETCKTWRLIAEAQHGHNTAPGPDALTVTFSPVAALREPEGEHYVHVHHSYRLGHDLPETGAQSADGVVAYRNPDRSDVLLCREHGDGWWGLIPLTSDDLPDGGTCTWGMPFEDEVCGRDVLIDPKSGGQR